MAGMSRGIGGGSSRDTKTDLIAHAVEVGDHGRSRAPDAAAYLEHYYRNVTVEDLLDRDPIDVFGAALSHRELAQQRPVGVSAVRIFTPSVEEHGWSSGHTVVEIVTDDMPFLVDSVTSYLAQQRRAIHLVIHPVLAVRRSVVGDLVELVDELPAGTDREVGLESWMHIEIDREVDRDKLEAITEGLRRVLNDVREAVEDWPKMREAALRIADELATTPPPLPDAEVSEGWELLRWFADDHFTFLGYREYDLVETDGGRRAGGPSRHRAGHPAQRPGQVRVLRRAAARRRGPRPGRSGC